MQDSFKQAPEGHGSTSSKLMFFCSLYLSQAKHSPELSLELYLKLSLKPRMHKVLNRPDTDSKLSFLRLLPEPKVQSSLSADKSSHSVIFFLYALLLTCCEWRSLNVVATLRLKSFHRRLYFWLVPIVMGHPFQPTPLIVIWNKDGKLLIVIKYSPLLKNNGWKWHFKKFF